MQPYHSIKEDVLAKLQRELPFLSETFGVATIGIFGSVSRGEDTPASDVDVLVTFQPGKKNIRNYMGLMYHLEDLFGRKVDLLTEARHQSVYQTAYCGGADFMQSDLTNLLHIKKETAYLCHILATYSHETFMQDEMCHIPWRLIAGTRDKLIHGYFDVDYDLVWGTLVQDIPSLDKAVGSFISNQNEQSEFL